MVEFLLVEITLFLSSLMGNAVISAGGNAVASNCKLMFLHAEILTVVFLLAKICFFSDSRNSVFLLMERVVFLPTSGNCGLSAFCVFVLMLLMLLVVY